MAEVQRSEGRSFFGQYSDCGTGDLGAGEVEGAPAIVLGQQSQKVGVAKLGRSVKPGRRLLRVADTEDMGTQHDAVLVRDKAQWGVGPCTTRESKGGAAGVEPSADEAYLLHGRRAGEKLAMPLGQILGHAPAQDGTVGSRAVVEHAVKAVAAAGRIDVAVEIRAEGLPRLAASEPDFDVIAPPAGNAATKHTADVVKALDTSVDNEGSLWRVKAT